MQRSSRSASIPNGRNINDQVGSTAPQTLVGDGGGLAARRSASRSDGDADRLIVVDENGRVVDGDQLMATDRRGLGACRAG